MALAAIGRTARLPWIWARALAQWVERHAGVLANALTIGRLLFVGPIVYLVHLGSYEAAFWLFAAAAVTDSADGFIARRFNGHTELGAILDPVADKVFVLSTGLALAIAGLLPWWLIGLFALRDSFLVAGVLVLRKRIEDFHVQPLMIGKASTFLQLVLEASVLAQAAGLLATAALIDVLIPTAALVTALSAVFYLVSGRRKLRSLAHPQPGAEATDAKPAADRKRAGSSPDQRGSRH